MKKLVLLFSCVLLVQVQAQFEKYQVQSNTNLNVDRSLWLIQATRTRDRITCLVQCNQDEECLSSTFSVQQQQQQQLDNCFLYRKLFNTSEFVASNNVNYYCRSCNLVRTLNVTACVNKPKTFLNIFRIYQIRHTFTVYDTLNNSFASVHSFVSATDITTNRTLYYALQSSNINLLVFNESWRCERSVPLGQVTFATKSSGNELFITANNITLRTDSSLNLLKIVNRSGNYRGIYLNETEGLLYIAVQNSDRIDVFDTSLVFQRLVRLGGYTAFAITAFNNSLYVGTTNGTILVIDNLMVSRVYNTVCLFISSLLIDRYGYMIVLCRNPRSALIYHVNGTYTGHSLTFSGSDALSINFDTKGRLVIMTSNGMHILY